MYSGLRTLLVAVGMLFAGHVGCPTERAAASAELDFVTTCPTALITRDVDECLASFSEDAVVIQPPVGGLPQIYVGHGQIRWWLTQLVELNTSFAAREPAELDRGRLRWTATFSSDPLRHLGFDAVEVASVAELDEDGRLQSLTTVYTPATARRMQAAPTLGSGQFSQRADATTGAPLLDLGLLAGLGGGVGVAFVVARRRWREWRGAVLLARSG